MHEEIKFHTDCAMRELAAASRCPDRRAAEAHLNLSALHLQRMRQLSDILAGPFRLRTA